MTLFQRIILEILGISKRAVLIHKLKIQGRFSPPRQRRPLGGGGMTFTESSTVEQMTSKRPRAGRSGKRQQMRE